MSVMMVFAAVPAATVTTTGNVLVEPGATLGLEQLMDPAVVQVHPAGTGVRETKVVLAGIDSVKVAVLQLLGPELVTTWVYVILAPAVTGLGAPLSVTARSQAVATGVVVVVLLVSEFAAETDEVAVIGVAVILGATLTTTTMAADVFAARLGSVQVTLPVAPTAGLVHVQPAGAETEANVALVGTASRKLTVVAAEGPLLVIVCMYVMSLPAYTARGVEAVLRARSAWDVEAVTVSDATAMLGPEVWFVAVTVAVLLMVVPTEVPAFTW
jgi:hypothetical protein